MAFEYEGTQWYTKQAVMTVWEGSFPRGLYITESLEQAQGRIKSLCRVMLFWKHCQMHSFQKSCSPKLLSPNILIILSLHINEEQKLGYVQPSGLGSVIRFHKKPSRRETRWNDQEIRIMPCFFHQGFKEPERSMVHFYGLNIPHYNRVLPRFS